MQEQNSKRWIAHWKESFVQIKDNKAILSRWLYIYFIQTDKKLENIILNEYEIEGFDNIDIVQIKLE